MTSLPDEAKKLVTRNPEIGTRVSGLEAAATIARGRLDDEVVDDALTIADRATGRLRLSADHTVVAIGGATGSGKSSTFNALTELEISSVGVRRPTTSWATACVWGREGAEELLEWLGIPPRHQVTRDSMLDSGKQGAANPLDGVVLLDLPDHDSMEVSHHLEVDRLVVLADLLVWVLDPQKYADAAIHDRYLTPLASHQDVMVVVLNHIDTVPEDRREAMLGDVRRLLVEEGLDQVPVLGVSAREGWGIEELKQLIAARVEEKKATRARIQADLREAAHRLSDAVGTASVRELTRSRTQELEEAVVAAAGIPDVVAGVERGTRMRARRATGWPLLSVVGGLRPDPVKRLDLDLGSVVADLRPRRRGVPQIGPVQRSRVDNAVRQLADDTSAGLTEAWALGITEVTVDRLPELDDRLDRELAEVDLGGRLPFGVHLARVVQWLLLLAAVGGGVWWALDAAGVVGAAPQVAGYALPPVLLVGGVVLGLVLAVALLGLGAAVARRRAEAADRDLRAVVHRALTEVVLDPLQAELEDYRRLRAALAQALN